MADDIEVICLRRQMKNSEIRKYFLREGIARKFNDLPGLTSHRETCNISMQSLSEFEKYHRDAVTARDNACSGRPVRPFPPEIIRR
jgi:hypothetical protein